MRAGAHASARRPSCTLVAPVSDARSEILRLCREATASLQRLEAPTTSPRAWAQEHFAALVAIERAAARLGPAPDRRPEAEADDVHAALLRALRGFFAASAGDDDPVGAALGALMQIAGARRGFVAVRQADGALAFPSARSFSEVELGRPEIEVSRTILEAAIRGGAHPLAIDDARADARFAGTTSVQRLAVRSVLAVPLVDEGRAYGVVYLDSPGEAAAFDARRREAAGAFAAAVASPLRAALAREPLTAARAPGSRLAQLRRAHDLAGLGGESPALTVVAERLLAVAPTDAPALISGETGVGKQLVAALLHRNSRRAAGPVITLRCAFAAEGPPGRLRAALDEARGGTLILDEIDALAPAQQGALVAELDGERAREGGARVLAISRRNHRTLAAEGTLRAELLYRVCVVEIEVPPLRERARDIDAIARGVLAALAARQGAAPRRLQREALARLEHYPWPGNVRELENVLASASLAAADVIGVEHLPAHLRDHEPIAPSSGAGLKEAVRAFRRRFVEQAMSEAGADHKQAAAALGVHPKYLFKLLRELRDDG
jgi:Nif-specific regulatory protein